VLAGWVILIKYSVKQGITCWAGWSSGWVIPWPAGELGWRFRGDRFGAWSGEVSLASSSKISSIFSEVNDNEHRRIDVIKKKEKENWLNNVTYSLIRFMSLWTFSFMSLWNFAIMNFFIFSRNFRGWFCRRWGIAQCGSFDLWLQ